MHALVVSMHRLLNLGTNGDSLLDVHSVTHLQDILNHTGVCGIAYHIRSQAIIPGKSYSHSDNFELTIYLCVQDAV